MNAEAERLLTNPRDRIAFQHLERLVQSKDALAMIGAGCSARMGYPAWGTLLNQMHECLSQRHGEGAQSGRESLRRHDDMLWRAEEYRRLLGPDYGRLLTEEFSRERAVDSCIKDIVSLPFRHVLTTNYDTSLERAHSAVRTEELHRVDWGDEPAVLEFLFRFFDPSYGRQYVYLHGRISNLDNVVLTDDDYTTRYLRSEGTVKRLFALFALQKMVFFGFSLTDPDLMAILRQVNVAVGFTEPRHVALVGLDGTEDREIHRGRLIKKFGINPVFYDRRDDHAELAVFARSLVESCGQGTTDRSAPVAKPPMAPPPAPARAPASAPVRAAARPADLPANPIDAEDPQRGRFGGLAERPGRRLSATVTQIDADWFAVAIRVSSTQGKPPLAGDVFFYLHDSFLTPVVKVTAHHGEAAVRIECYGAFTVGAFIENEPDSMLELCLATLEGAPMQFVMS